MKHLVHFTATLLLVSGTFACSGDRSASSPDTPANTSTGGDAPLSDDSPVPPDVPSEEGTQCGARAGDTCSDTEYCAYEEGQYCGAADAQSICKPRPEACTFDMNPVCGCDGKTYSNACQANSSGTGVQSKGECSAE